MVLSIISQFSLRAIWRKIGADCSNQFCLKPSGLHMVAKERLVQDLYPHAAFVCPGWSKLSKIFLKVSKFSEKFLVPENCETIRCAAVHFGWGSRFSLRTAGNNASLLNNSSVKILWRNWRIKAQRFPFTQYSFSYLFSAASISEQVHFLWCRLLYLIGLIFMN